MLGDLGRCGEIAHLVVDDILARIRRERPAIIVCALEFGVDRLVLSTHRGRVLACPVERVLEAVTKDKRLPAEHPVD